LPALHSFPTRRSSDLAAGVIGVRHLVRAALWELVFIAYGLSAETIARRAERAMWLLRGFRVDDLRQLVADAMEPVLKPLLFSERSEEHTSELQSRVDI